MFFVAERNTQYWPAVFQTTLNAFPGVSKSQRRHQARQHVPGTVLYLGHVTGKRENHRVSLEQSISWGEQ